MINESILCLAIAIFHESRGESKKAQYAVAEVIHNRTKHPDYPDNYCAVIKQKGQFSFVKNHKSMTAPKFELESWKESIAVARDFERKKSNHVGKALYFNTVKLGIRYKTKTKSVKIGNHIFY
jgi:N-acetylmuramoyl-L-alanine amidase